MGQTISSAGAPFACRHCGAQGGPLIGGACADCDPERHRLLRQADAAFKWHTTAYALITGRPAADDWAAFDHWRQSHRQAHP